MMGQEFLEQVCAEVKKNRWASLPENGPKDHGWTTEGFAEALRLQGMGFEQYEGKLGQRIGVFGLDIGRNCLVMWGSEAHRESLSAAPARPTC